MVKVLSERKREAPISLVRAGLIALEASARPYVKKMYEGITVRVGLVTTKEMFGIQK